jgi:excisionase family DNA binding protein
MSDPATTGEAARRLGTSTPTVRALIEKGLLSATREQRGERFRWLIDDSSLQEYLDLHGRFDGHRRAGTGQLAAMEAELSVIRRAVAMGSREYPPEDPSVEVERERDHLRSEVVNLQEALVRMRSVADLQHEVDAARATAMEHLLAAVAAGEKADSLRRNALAELEEALATFSRPRHAGDVS